MARRVPAQTHRSRALSEFRSASGAMPMQLWIDPALAVRIDRAAEAMNQPRSHFVADVLAERVTEMEADAMRLLAAERSTVAA